MFWVEVEEMLLNGLLPNFGGLTEVGHLDYPDQQFHFQLKNNIVIVKYKLTNRSFAYEENENISKAKIT